MKVESVPKVEGEWNSQEDHLLGTATDVEIAKRLGRSGAAVQQRRKRLAIPKFHQFRPWTPEEDKLLGTAPDRIIGQKIARSKGSVYQRRRLLRITRPQRPWKPEEEKLLGTLLIRKWAAGLAALKPQSG